MARVQRVTQENFINGAGSSVANRLLTNGFNCNALRSNAVLRKEEWQQFDQVVVDVARQRLNGVADLVNAGLTYDLDDALGVTMVQWERQADMDPAQRSMDGLTRGERDRLDFLQSNVPVFITHKDFGLSLRVLRASRKLGQPLDTAQIEVATRKVADSIEDALFNGPGVVVNAVTAYGYRTAPNRNTMNFASAQEWTHASKTGELILADVITMIQTAHTDNRFGPYVLYVTGEDYVALMEDFRLIPTRLSFRGFWISKVSQLLSLLMFFRLTMCF